ncbi:MAG: isoprenylcysteine carboxylmethyltransferase family protein [Anaerolineales bacterium]|nr:isoprenylcysteine carboxylmethyltransferase family protein [Anaerolineales bacterium]
MSPRLVAFLAGSALLAGTSRSSLLKPRSHGFYRYFAFECLLGLVCLNLSTWFQRPAAPLQLASWALLGGSIALAAQGFSQLIRQGEPSGSIETTTVLVATGVYRRIRHPLYASLLCFAWGVALKGPSVESGITVLAASVLMYLTARAEEHENRKRFGEAYAKYAAGTKMFIPFVF